VQTAGETWVYTRDGLTRLRTEDLERAFREPSLRIPVRTFGFLDGLIDSNSVRPPRALVRGGDGRLWGATATGIVWIDPAHLVSNPLPPRIAIRSIQTDRRRYRDPASLSLPAGSANVAVEFAVLSLTMPERVRVRYRLEGQDDRWIDPGLRRQAFYTNLGPGRYRFHVIAANESGVWNRRGATVEFTIAPTFVQSVGFKLLLALLVAALLAGAYAVRLRQVTARLQSWFDIRVAERERIARELHDTLLQGFQGLLLHFKAAANRVAEPKSRQSLEGAIERAQQVLIEGRDRVRDLRAEPHHQELADALLQLTSAEAGEDGPRIRLTQEGASRPLHPLVRAELERIVEEAVRNAVAHARASSIEILLIWGRRELKLAVRDDGVGLPAPVLSLGRRDGHFGLVGMRERAVRIGGTLHVTSGASGGTEVALVVPGQGAYKDHVRRVRDRAHEVWRGWRRRASGAEPAGARNERIVEAVSTSASSGPA
jgi:signal transduction histidine kinase